MSDINVPACVVTVLIDRRAVDTAVDQERDTLLVASLAGSVERATPVLSHSFNVCSLAVFFVDLCPRNISFKSQAVRRPRPTASSAKLRGDPAGLPLLPRSYPYQLGRRLGPSPKPLTTPLPNNFRNCFWYLVMTNFRLVIL